jgi:hypothetical protein
VAVFRCRTGQPVTSNPIARRRCPPPPAHRYGLTGHRTHTPQPVRRRHAEVKKITIPNYPVTPPALGGAKQLVPPIQVAVHPCMPWRTASSQHATTMTMTARALTNHQLRVADRRHLPLDKHTCTLLTTLPTNLQRVSDCHAHPSATKRTFHPLMQASKLCPPTHGPCRTPCTQPRTLSTSPAGAPSRHQD